MTDDEKETLLTAVKEISASMTRVAGERDFVKETSKSVCEELQLDKKVFKKIVQTYYKQNLDEEKATFAEFETLYEEVTKP